MTEKKLINRKTTATTFTPQDTVRAYCESQAIARAKTIKIVVNRLERWLGRPALLQDLTDETISAFFKFLKDGTRLRAVTVHGYQETILKIARHAASRDVIQWPLADWESIIPDDRRGDDPGRLGLLRYFEEVYSIERIAAGTPLKAETAKAYRSAIRAFQRWQPGLHQMYNVNQAAICGFREWLLRCGMNAKKAGNHAFAVAAVVKHAIPERFIGATSPKEPADPRALAVVLEHQFGPSHPGNKAITEQAYRAVFNSFGRYLGNVATLDDLTDEKVGGYMRALLHAGKRQRTVNGYRSKLVSMWSWCARKRLVEHFPTVLPIAAALAFPRAWSADDLRALLKACDAMPGYVAGIPAPLWWRALHLVAWNSGERTGALLALTWEMLNPKTGVVVVPAEFRKGGRKPMLYTLKPATLRALESIQEPVRELIFPFPRSSFFGHYKRLLKLAGLPYVRYKSCIQKMRKSFATHIEAAGGNATDALSHSQRSITEESYLDPTLIHRTPANELLFPIEAATA